MVPPHTPPPSGFVTVQGFFDSLIRPLGNKRAFFFVEKPRSCMERGFGHSSVMGRPVRALM